MDKRENELRIEYKGDPFTMVPNNILINSSIHPCTRLLYCIIKHYITIPHFKIFKLTLKKNLGVKTDKAFDKYWKQLKRLGYLEQIKKRNKTGKYEYTYILHGEKHQFTTPPKKEGVVEPPGEEMDLFNNIDLNNTDINKKEKILEGKKATEIIYSIPLTSKQKNDIDRLLLDIALHKISATKQSLYEYIVKLYKNDFKDMKGKDIGSLYGYVKTNFNIKTKKDKEKEMLNPHIPKPYKGYIKHNISPSITPKIINTESNNEPFNRVHEKGEQI